MNEPAADEKGEIPEGTRRSSGGTAVTPLVHAANVATLRAESGDSGSTLIEKILQHDNLIAAYRRVKQNGGAPGVDGMTVEELGKFPREYYAAIWERIRNGTYQPQPVLRVEIPKPDGKGVRMLGIPTVMDRMIQQAVLQQLQPIFEPTFSEGSFGFRPGRSAHQAILRAREFVANGHRWVIDFDLEKFFDRVNHDILMTRIARRVKDQAVLRLIRRYLQAGMMMDGVVSPRSEGTPQGGPLSPLLSNILLNDLDKELEGRGHKFVRYADDCNVYVKSEAAGKRVMASIEGFLEKRLRLKINRDKSAVARPWERKFLGYSFAVRGAKIVIAPQSFERLRRKLRPILRRGRGRNLATVIHELSLIIRGWSAYFRLAEVKGKIEELDIWLRRKLRCIVWRQWKKPKKRFQELRRLGLDTSHAHQSASNGRGPWWNAGQRHMSLAVSSKYLRTLGYVSFLEEHRRLASS
jgi:RNA-directed DNA polymerase